MLTSRPSTDPAGRRAGVPAVRRARVPRICLLVDGRTPLPLLPDLVAAGVDGFQVRDKEYAGAALLALVERVLAAVGDRAGVVVNDRVDVALAAGAHGVHLGAEDLPPGIARSLGGDLLVGATCRDGEAARRAGEHGADYAGVGPVFTNAGKPGLPDPVGTAAVSAAAEHLPVLAIGGVNAGNAARAVAAGATGVAVIGAVWSAQDPVAAAGDLVAEARR